MLIAFAVLTELDVTGFETRVPEAAGIESVDLSDGWQVKEPETIAAILDFHRGVIDHKKANEAAGTLQSEMVWLSYQLKNGETLPLKSKEFQKAYHNFMFLVNH